MSEGIQGTVAKPSRFLRPTQTVKSLHISLHYPLERAEIIVTAVFNHASANT